MKIVLSCILLLLIVQSAKGQFTFPLQIGNRWQYKEPPPPDEPYMYEDRVVGDTLMPNGEIFRAINIAGGDQFYYYRQEGQKVYEFLTTGDSLHRNQEILRFDFSKGLHDMVSVFQISAWDTVVITVMDMGTLSVFGRIRPYMTFYWSERGGAFYRMNRIVDSLGMTFYQIEPGYQLDLAGAVLNGVTYGQVVSVPEHHEELPSEYSLRQNYPNPFNPTTTIVYSVPYRSCVKLAIFNTLGQQVATLVNDEVEAGYHEVRLDASGLATGVYFYRLQAGDVVEVKRLMCLK